jgi:hypothetical protein
VTSESKITTQDITIGLAALMVAIELSLVVNMAFATVSPACDETRAKKIALRENLNLP